MQVRFGHSERRLALWRTRSGKLRDGARYHAVGPACGAELRVATRLTRTRQDPCLGMSSAARPEVSRVTTIQPL